MQPDIRQFVALFRAGAFHAAHDVLEPRWTRTRSHTLHGLIQLAVGWHHFRRNNLHGARVLWTKALAHLERAESEPDEGVDLDEARAHLRWALDSLPPGRRLERPVPGFPAPPLLTPSQRKLMNGQTALVLHELEELKRTRDNVWNVTWDTGQFLRILALSMKATRILEIGMSNGFSTVWWASAVQANGGTVTTLEIDPNKVREARENFQRAGVADVVNIVEGDAREIIPTLDGSWDIVFVDAWKGEDAMAYFRLAAPQVRVGGVMVADNVASHPEDMAGYVNLVRNAPGWESVLLPVGQGQEVSIKVHPAE